MNLKGRVAKLEKKLVLAYTGPSLPDIIVHFEEPLLDSQGNHIPGGRTSDPDTAECHGKTFDRLPGESIDAFTDRVIKLEKKNSPFSTIVLLGPDRARND